MFNRNQKDQPVKSDRNIVFAVLDEKASAYGIPMVHPTIAVAIRSFDAATENPQSFISKYPDDYALYALGTYDERSGKIECYPEPRFVIRAREIINNKMPKPQEVNSNAQINN